MKFLSRIVFLMFLSVVFHNCKKDDANFKLASVEISAIDSVLYNSIVVQASVLEQGSSIVTQRGVCWSEVTLPTLDASKLEAGEGLGDFSLSVIDLNPNTTYYIRAYAKTGYGISYSSEDTVKTLALAVPVVASGDTSAVLQNSAVVSGIISDDGGQPIISRGVCWSLNSLPTVADSIVYSDDEVEAFSTSINGLVVSTTYYYRSFAINSVGVGYGEVKHFETLPVSLPVLALGSATSVDNISANYAYSVASEGGAELLLSGVCISTTGIPEITDRVRLSSGNKFAFTAIIDSLQGATTYYIRSFATNIAGVGYGEVDTILTLAPTLATVTVGEVVNITTKTADCDGVIVDNGGAEVIKSGVCWSTSPNPTTNSLKNYNLTGDASFTVAMSGLKASKSYYVRAFVVNSVGTAYSEMTTFSTPAAAVPVVVTGNTTEITSVAAVCSGEVTDGGGAFVSEKGICWSTSSNPTVDSAKVIAGTGVGAFAINLTNLTPSTTYYYKSYAINSVGIVYGQELLFKTNQTSITYTLYKAANPTATQLQMYAKIEAAMNSACAYYSDYTNINKHLNVYYEPSVPTADGSNNGTIRFGNPNTMQTATAMHEIAHTLGVGTNWTWSANLMKNGVYVGAKANAVYQAIAGDTSVKIHGDGAHFWPLGLNYESEVKSNQDLINHCKVVQAMIDDGL